MSSAARNYPPATGTSGCDRQFDITMKNTRSDEELAGTNGGPIEIPNVGSTDLCDDSDFDPFAAAASDTMTPYAPTGPVPHAVSHQAQAHLAGSDVGMDIDPDLKKRSSKRKSAQAAMAMIAAQERESTTLWASSDSTGPSSSSSSNGKRRKTTSARIDPRQQQAPSASKKSPRGRGKGRASSSSAPSAAQSPKGIEFKCVAEIIDKLLAFFDGMQQYRCFFSKGQLELLHSCLPVAEAIKHHLLALMFVGARGNGKSYSANCILYPEGKGSLPLPSKGGSNGVTKATIVLRHCSDMQHFDVRCFRDPTGRRATHTSMIEAVATITVPAGTTWAKELHDVLVSQGNDVVAVSVQGPFAHGRSDLIIVDTPGHSDGHPLHLDALTMPEMELQDVSFAILHCTQRAASAEEVLPVAEKLLPWPGFKQIKAFVNVVQTERVDQQSRQRLAQSQTALSAALMDGFDTAAQDLMQRDDDRQRVDLTAMSAHARRLLSVPPQFYYGETSSDHSAFHQLYRDSTNIARLDLASQLIQHMSAFALAIKSSKRRVAMADVSRSKLKKSLAQAANCLPDDATFVDDIISNNDAGANLAVSILQSWHSTIDTLGQRDDGALVASIANKALGRAQFQRELQAELEELLQRHASSASGASIAAEDASALAGSVKGIRRNIVRRIRGTAEQFSDDVHREFLTTCTPPQLSSDNGSAAASNQQQAREMMAQKVQDIVVACNAARKTLRHLSSELVPMEQKQLSTSLSRLPAVDVSWKHLPSTNAVKPMLLGWKPNFHSILFAESSNSSQRIPFKHRGGMLACVLNSRVTVAVDALKTGSAESTIQHGSRSKNYASSASSKASSISLVPIQMACFGTIDEDGAVPCDGSPSFPRLEKLIDKAERECSRVNMVVFLWCCESQLDAIEQFVKDWDVDFPKEDLFIVTLPDDLTGLHQRLLTLMNTFIHHLGAHRWWYVPTDIKRFCTYSPLILNTRKASMAAAFSMTERAMAQAEVMLRDRLQGHIRGSSQVHTKLFSLLPNALRGKDNLDLSETMSVFIQPVTQQPTKISETIINVAQHFEDDFDLLCAAMEPAIRWLGVLGTCLPTRNTVLYFQRHNSLRTSIVPASGVSRISKPGPILFNTQAMQCALSEQHENVSSWEAASSEQRDIDAFLLAHVKKLVSGQVHKGKTPQRPVLFKDVHDSFDDTV